MQIVNLLIVAPLACSQKGTPTRTLRFRMLAIIALVQLVGYLATFIYQDSAYSYHSNSLGLALFLILLSIFRVEMAELYEEEGANMISNFLPQLIWLSWCFFRQGFSYCLGYEASISAFLLLCRSLILLNYYINMIGELPARMHWHFFSLAALGLFAMVNLIETVIQLFKIEEVGFCQLNKVSAISLSLVIGTFLLEWYKWSSPKDSPDSLLLLQKR